MTQRVRQPITQTPGRTLISLEAPVQFASTSLLGRQYEARTSESSSQRHDRSDSIPAQKNPFVSGPTLLNSIRPQTSASVAPSLLNMREVGRTHRVASVANTAASFGLGLGSMTATPNSSASLVEAWLTATQPAAKSSMDDLSLLEDFQPLKKIRRAA